MTLGFGLRLEGIDAVFLNLVVLLELGQNDPRWYDGEEEDTEVDTDADKVVRIAFRLHTTARISINSTY